MTFFAGVAANFTYTYWAALKVLLFYKKFIINTLNNNGEVFQDNGAFSPKIGKKIA